MYKRQLEDIAKFPFVVKQDMRDNYPFGMFARENADVARIHACLLYTSRCV